MKTLGITAVVAILAIGISAPLAAADWLEVCNDGLDNDGDGLIDCRDETCARLPGCSPQYRATLDLIDNCPGEDLYVTVNAGADWTDNGQLICSAGQTCKIPAGVYGYDASHDGLDFHIGPEPDNATKAEVSYVLKKPNHGPPELSYDISLITMGGDCPNTCKDASCCQQQFNQPLRIYRSGVCRCLYCDGPGCPDAFHFPTDNSKQANCPASTKLTIEFCPTKNCTGEHGGVRPCNTSERQICSACTGNMVYCCPQESYGSPYECLCQVESRWCQAMPDPGSGCGTDQSKYCYVSNALAEMDAADTGFKFRVDNLIDESASICPLYGPSVTIWQPGSNQGIGLPYGLSRSFNADLSANGGLGIQVNFWYWDRQPGLPIQQGSPQTPQNPDNSGDNFMIDADCRIEHIETPWFGQGQRTSEIAEVTAHWSGDTCIVTVAPNQYTKCVTKNCCSPPGYANTCQAADAYVAECAIP